MMKALGRMHANIYRLPGTLLASVGVTVALGVSAQNRVQNGDFETLSGPCIGISDYTGELASWSMVGCSATPPNYYHPCTADNGFPYFSAPDNIMGYQEAYSGVAYVGLTTYSWGDGFDPQNFLTAHLTEPLYEGVEYCVSMRVSLADRSSFTSGSLHCVFTPEPPTLCDGEDTLLWPTMAQLILPLSAADTSSWIEITGSFIADGTYEYMAIGSLCTYTNCDTTFLGWNGPPDIHAAHYYVDDVVLNDCEVGVGELNGEELTVYPNPASQQVSIKLPQRSLGGSLEVLNATGERILAMPAMRDKTDLNLKCFSSGVYFLRLVKDSVIDRRVLVVQH